MSEEIKNNLDNLPLVKMVWKKTLASELPPLPSEKIEDAIRELIERLTKNRFTAIGDGINNSITILENELREL